MRLIILAAAAAIAMPTALIAHPASAPGVTQAVTDVSAAAKKKKKPAKKKEENLKAAPSAPSTKDKSMY